MLPIDLDLINVSTPLLLIISSYNHQGLGVKILNILNQEHIGERTQAHKNEFITTKHCIVHQ